MRRAKVGVGLIGLGRLGRAYARHLSSSVPEAELVAVCDLNEQVLRQVVEQYEVKAPCVDPAALIEHPDVQAVVIVSTTASHWELTERAVKAGKPIFCEKPLSVSLEEALAMRDSVRKADNFFQMGFMRRFDRGYVEARQKMEEGAIGRPVLFKATSRDPSRPSLEYLDPGNSGGIFVDMGIHDFDLALWLFGPVESVHSVGGVLAYPELEEIGDADTAVVTLRFCDGCLGVVDLSRRSTYGYDIQTEILGTGGAVRVGYLRENPVTVLTEDNVAHDTVPYFVERFAQAYTDQLSNFVASLVHNRPPAITVEDGLEALRVAVACTESWRRQTTVSLDEISGGESHE